jgi:hypothetical protein
VVSVNIAYSCPNGLIPDDRIVTRHPKCHRPSCTTRGDGWTLMPRENIDLFDGSRARERGDDPRQLGACQARHVISAKAE